MLRGLLVLSVLGLVGGLASSWWMAGRLSAPAPASCGEPPADLNAVAFETEDSAGRRVSGWRIPAGALSEEHTHGTLSLIHI